MARALASTDVFYAIADPTRRTLLDRLIGGEQPATALGSGLKISQPALSRHLRVLREAGLVGWRDQGRQRLYRIRAEKLKPVVDWVSHYQRFWPEKLDKLGIYLRQHNENDET